jgi:metal-responsive CopG/Arc/MetJ family transcriptional regulator
MPRVNAPTKLVVPVGVTLDQASIAELDAIAAETGLPRSSIIGHAIRTYLETRRRGDVA